MASKVAFLLITWLTSLSCWGQTTTSWIDEIPDSAEVFGFVLLIRESMLGTIGNPESLDTRLGLIEGIHHVRRHERIGAAMNEQHGVAALPDLLQSRRLAEAPAIAQTAKQACGIHQGEGRQAELLLQLAGELIPDAGVAAVLDEVQIPDAGGHLLAREHHRGGSTHRHPMHHHRVSLERLQPMQRIEPVLPAHLYGHALALATGMQLRHHNVVAQLVLVDTRQPEELNGTVAPAVNDEGRTSATSVDEESMMALARGHREKRVAQGPNGSQTVDPRLALRIGLELLPTARVGIHPVRIGRQRIVEHIKAAAN